MRVVIRFRRKPAKVEPTLSLALNGAGTLAVEPAASVAVAEPWIAPEPAAPQELAPVAEELAAPLVAAELVALLEPSAASALAQAEAVAPLAPQVAPVAEKPAEPVVIQEPLVLPELNAAPELVTAPPVRRSPTTKLDKVRCPRCNSLDTWRFGRVKGIRLAMASLARGQWITCRGCGNRFLSRHYGAMEEDDDD